MKMTRTLVAAAVSMAIAGPALADPPANPDLPSVFCFRITDMERVAGDAEGDAFRVEFEVLNWTGLDAAGVKMSLTQGTSAGVTIDGASIDPDGRGGPTGGTDIGPGVFDPISHQSGRGRGDIVDHLNDWNVLGQSGTDVTYSALNAAGTLVGTEIPHENLLFSTNARVPGTGTDALGDSAVDGGPGPYTVGPDDGNPLVAGMPPVPDGSGNVLDGFVIEIDGLGVGDVVGFNWFLLGEEGEEASFAAALSNGAGEDCSTDVPDCLFPIGVVGGGNEFGFGTFSLARIEIGGALPGALFVGNSGFNQNPVTFFDDVYEIPNPAEFGGEFGAGLTAPFLDPLDNVFGAPTNTTLIAVPEPATIGLSLAGVSAIFGVGWRRRRRNGWA